MMDVWFEFNSRQKSRDPQVLQKPLSATSEALNQVRDDLLDHLNIDVLSAGCCYVVPGLLSALFAVAGNHMTIESTYDKGHAAA